ncbi:hypothetical protein E4U42_004435 [Claviceps africana]|uniref:Uncharacterized protein n=1 Tax=Claviceps africana TaxID=83212 RepID=A0A8K0JHX1_9HYPO|nr:hypothetical protein E4U42_004435 [Claviceps africana]
MTHGNKDRRHNRGRYKMLDMNKNKASNDNNCNGDITQRFNEDTSSSNRRTLAPQNRSNEKQQRSQDCLQHAWHQIALGNGEPMTPCSSLLSGAINASAAAAMQRDSSFSPSATDFQGISAAQLTTSDSGFEASDPEGSDPLGAGEFPFLLDFNCDEIGDLHFSDAAFAATTLRGVPANNTVQDESDIEVESNEPGTAASPPANEGLVDCSGMASILVTLGHIFDELSCLNNTPSDAWNLCDESMQEALFGRLALSHVVERQANGKLLQCAMDIAIKFVWALQTISPVSCRVGITQPASPSAAVKLMILLTYLQLGQMFDNMLTTLIQLPNRKRSDTRDTSSGTDSRFRSGDQCSSQHITMLARVIEHQFHYAECLIGLPEDCRLWSRQDLYVGILDKDCLSEISQSVMGQVKNKFKSLKQTMDKISRLSEVSLPPPRGT